MKIIMCHFNIPEEEWQIAYKLLEKAANGTKLPYSMCYENGVLVPRKRYIDNPKPYKTTHSFIKINGEIYALAQGKKIDAAITKGTTAKLKYACNSTGVQFLVKISNGMTEQEANIMMDLSQSAGFNERIDKSKLYAVILFLGTDLKDYLTQNHAILNEDQRFDIAIKLCWQVFCLHEGLSSKTATPYAHYDIKHDNATIDKNGDIHLIDYGFAEENPEKLAYIKSGAAAYMPYAKRFDLTGEQIDVVSLKRTLFAPESYYCPSGLEKDDVKRLFCYRVLTEEMLDKHKLSSYINTYAKRNSYPDYQKEHLPAKTLCALLVAAKLKLKTSYEVIKNNLDLALTISSLYMHGKAEEIEKIIESEEDVKLIGTLQTANQISRFEEYKSRKDFCYLMRQADSREKRLALVYIDEVGLIKESERLINSNDVAVAIIDIKKQFKDPDTVKKFIKKMLSNNAYSDSYNFLNKYLIGNKRYKKYFVSVMDNENEATLISNIDDMEIKRSIISLIRSNKYSYENVLKLSNNKELAKVIIEFNNNFSFVSKAIDFPDAVLKTYKNCNLVKIGSDAQLPILLSDVYSKALNILVEANIHIDHDLSKISLSEVSQIIIKLEELNLNELYGFVVSHDVDKCLGFLKQVLNNSCISEITANMISNKYMLEALYNTNNNVNQTNFLIILFKLGLINEETLKIIHSSKHLCDIVLLLHENNLDIYISQCIDSSIEKDKLYKALLEASGEEEIEFVMQNISYFQSGRANTYSLEKLKALKAMNDAGVEQDTDNINAYQIKAINLLVKHNAANSIYLELVIKNQRLMKAIIDSSEEYQIKALLITSGYVNDYFLNKLIRYPENSLLYKMLCTAQDEKQANHFVLLLEQLDILTHKEENLNNRNESSAAQVCHDTVEKLVNYLNDFFDPKKEGQERNLDRFLELKENCSNTISESRKVLEKHRGIWGVLDIILTVMASLIVFYPAVYAYQTYSGINYTFFKTESAKTLDTIDLILTIH